MKRIALVMFMVFIAGCGVSFDSETISRSQELCENNDGVKRIFAFWSGNVEVSCNNGAVFYNSVINAEKDND